MKQNRKLNILVFNSLLTCDLSDSICNYSYFNNGENLTFYSRI